jgi:hypothetical protein
MRLLAYGPVSAMAMFLTVDAIPAVPAVPPQILQGGELAVLAWTIWYVLARVLPAHTAALAAQRDAFLRAGHGDKEDG